MDSHFGESTMLSVLFGVAQNDAGERRRQLERFSRTYDKPLITFLIRAKHFDCDRASDVVQDFWLKKLIEPSAADNLVAKYLATLGDDRPAERLPFRNYLRRSIVNYAIDHERQRKRDRQNVSLDAFEGASPSASNEEVAFDVAWANSLLESVVRRVHSECVEKNQNRMWDLFCRHVLIPSLVGTPTSGYAELAKEHGFESARAAANAVRTIVRKFQSHLEDQVRDYLPVRSLTESTNLIEREFEDIVQILSRPGALRTEIFHEFVPSAQTTDPTPQMASTASHTATSRFLFHSTADLFRSDSDYAACWQEIRQTRIVDWLDETGAQISQRIVMTLGELMGGKPVREQIIVQVRNEAKARAKSTDGMPPEVLAVIYMGAIANGFTNTKTLASTDPVHAIDKRLAKLLTFSWLDLESHRALSEFRSMLSDGKT